MQSFSLLVFAWFINVHMCTGDVVGRKVEANCMNNTLYTIQKYKVEGLRLPPASIPSWKQQGYEMGIFKEIKQLERNLDEQFRSFPPYFQVRKMSFPLAPSIFGN